MKKKAFVLTLVLAVLFSPVIGLQMVQFSFANFFPEPAPEGIRIESDGTVNGTDKIQRDGDVYTLTGNVEGTIVVLRNDIVIDGAGYVLQGDGTSAGVWLQDSKNVRISSLEIRGFYCGIRFTWKSYDWVGSRYNIVSDNVIVENSIGIQLDLFTGNNYFYGNTVADNSYGVMVIHSPNNVFKSNCLRDNEFNLWVYVETSAQASYFFNDIDTSNTVDGKPVYYWVDQHDRTVPSDAGYVAWIGCSGITVQNLTLANNGQGMLLAATNNSLITENRIMNNGVGIVVYGPFDPCANNTITRNQITGSAEQDIYIWNDLQNNIHDNNITPTPTPTPTPAITPSPSPSSSPQETEPFPVLPVAAASVAAIVVLVTILLVYLKKCTRQACLAGSK